MSNKVGVIAGNFDVIHPGYIITFKECVKHCDKLVILLHNDPSVERPNKMKPILSLEERIEMLLSLTMVDEVLSYNTEDELYKLLEVGNYGVRFLGEDYIGVKFTGSELNIPLYFINRDHGWSTTKYKELISDSVIKRKQNMESTNYNNTTFPLMSKASIVSRLLAEKHITTDEAVVLLSGEAPAQTQPLVPYTPYKSPYEVPYCTCGNDGTKPCWSTACPKRLIVTYCSTNTMDNKQ
jgi:glycerol-3-phosphate cytidylyltransferase